MQRLCGRRTRGNLSSGRMGDKGNELRLRSSTCRDQRTCANARRRRFDGQMAKQTGVGRRIGVMVPDHSERRPQHQHEERNREKHTPNSLMVRHIYGTL